MSVLITGVEKDSVCENKIKKGEKLISISGHNITDVIDYMYYSDDEKLSITVEGIDGKIREVRITKKPDTDLGLTFESYLMDCIQSCTNKCIFCFIDQLPSGMRETLYFKDDDARMSLFEGNYITLTNLKEKDISRICDMKISPVNISVHTTDPDLRVKMLNNKFAGKCHEIMQKFAKSGIKQNCQIVLCKGINDKEHLDKTMNDLKALYPSVASVCVVPVGLTKHRQGLYLLESITSEDAKEIIAQVNSFGDMCLKKHGTRLFYLADEFYLKAGLEIPDYEYYEDYPQYENGVGILCSFKDEFLSELKYTDKTNIKRNIAVITGMAAYEFIKDLCGKVKTVAPNINITVIPVKNDYFGETVTVAGLVTGIDIKKNIKGKNFDEILIPACMLRYDRDRFLCNTTLKQLEEETNQKITVAEIDGALFLQNILGG